MGDTDDTKEDESEIIAVIVPMWKERDPDLKLVLPLGEVMDLIREVVIEMRHQNRRGRWEWVEDCPLVSPDQIVDRQVLRSANELRLQVSATGQVHAFSAIRAILRKAILLNDPLALEQMDTLDRTMQTDQNVASLGMTARAKKRQDKIINQDEDMLSLEEIYAASFIQKRFKDLVERKRSAQEAALARGISKKDFEAQRERAKEEKREQMEEKRRNSSVGVNSAASSPSKTSSFSTSPQGARRDSRSLEKRDSKESKDARPTVGAADGRGGGGLPGALPTEVLPGSLPQEDEPDADWPPKPPDVLPAGGPPSMHASTALDKG